MSTTSEGINKESSSQLLCNVVMRLKLFLFDSHLMGNLLLMNLVGFTDNSKAKKQQQLLL
jgi:hypothetical protein